MDDKIDNRLILNKCMKTVNELNRLVVAWFVDTTLERLLHDVYAMTAETVNLWYGEQKKKKSRATKKSNLRR